MARSKDPDLLTFVEDAIVLGYGLRGIVRLVEEHPDLETVTERTISRYITQIRERWATEEVELRPMRRAELRQRAVGLHLQARLEGGKSLGTAATCLKILQEMDGLKAPAKLEISGQIDVRAMSPDQRRERLAQLWSLRKKLEAEGKVKPLVIDVPAEPKKLPAAKPRKTPAKKATKKPKKAPAKRARKTNRK